MLKSERARSDEIYTTNIKNKEKIKFMDQQLNDKTKHI